MMNIIIYSLNLNCCYLSTGVNNDLATENIKERLLLHLNDRCHKMSDIYSKESYTATTYTPIK